LSDFSSVSQNPSVLSMQQPFLSTVRLIPPARPVVDLVRSRDRPLKA